jgi:uncharacterized protein YkwD
MKYVLLAFFAILSKPVFTQGVLTLQDKPFVYNAPMDSVLYKELSTDKNFRLLGKSEQQMYYWTNVFRKDPNRFYNDVIKEFLKQFPEANTADVTSLKKDIQKIKTLPLIFPDIGLINMSRNHSADLAKRGGIISHKSAGGKDFVNRIKEAGPYRCGAENIFSGTPDFLEALVALLIDQGVADKGHRVNLLDPRFERMGISITPISSKKGVIVQDFACK